MTARRRLRTVVLALLLALAMCPTTWAAAAAPTPSAPARAASAPASPAERPPPAPAVAVLGVAGLQWSDVGPRTPALRSLVDRGARGVLSVKARPEVSCAGDGWLTLGAGARAELFGDRRCGPVPPELSTTDLRRQQRRNAATLDGARVGALAAALDVPVTAVGPGARLAVGAAAGDASTGTPTTRGTGVRVVDLGGVGVQDRAAALARVDRALADEVRRLPATTDVLLVGVSAPAGADAAALHVAVAAGPSFPRGGLRSASTRRAPYVQLVDVAPTVLDLVGAPVPGVMDGQPWRVVAAAPTVAELAALEARAETARRVTVPFFVVLVAALVLVLGATWRRPRALRLAALSFTAAPGASYAAQVVPWERTPEPLLTLLVVVAALAVAAAAATRSVGGVCGLTAAVLSADLLAGGPLQMDAVAGYSPLVAGRFAGLGNVAFGIYGSCWLLAAASLVHRRGPNPVLVAALAAVAVAVVGAPPWGSDVGGVLALLPAFVVLGLRTAGGRVSALRLALAVGASVGVVAAFALLDLARPPQDRTHLGRFAADLADGTAGDLLARKASSVLGLLLSGPLTVLLPLVVAAAVALVLRPPPPLRRAFAVVPALRHALTAVGVLAALGFALNDSGAAVPATALLVSVPATVAVVAAVREAGRADRDADAGVPPSPLRRVPL